MSSGADIRSEQQARAILKLAASDPPSTWRAAFQRAAKAAHPDQGGDAEHMRLVIESYRFLTRVERKPTGRTTSRPDWWSERAKPAAAPEASTEQHDGPISISITEAFRGTERTLRLASGRQVKLRLPAGLQTGDVLRFGEEGEHRLTVEVAARPGVQLKGADLWLTVAVSAEFLKVGGRMEVETPLGPRRFWVSRTSADRGLFRAPGEGLPARSNRPRGHLYLAFKLDETLTANPVQALLARFASVWAAQ